MNTTDLGTSQNHRTIGGLSKEQLDDAKEGILRLVDRLEGIIRERPGTALLAAIGLGFLVGRIARR